MRLVVVAHGTRRPLGNAVASLIAARAGERLGMPSVAAYVELCQPSLAEALVASDEPALVVPLLLSTGHHVRVDLPAATAGEAVLGGPLGPDPLLARAQADRLVAAGAVPGQPVVMVATGSRDPAAARDLRLAAEMLGAAWDGPVRLVTLSGSGPGLADVVGPGDAVSPYLLAPGFFSARARGLAESAGAEVVADVIGPHPAVVSLVCRRAVSMLRAEVAEGVA